MISESLRFDSWWRYVESCEEVNIQFIFLQRTDQQSAEPLDSWLSRRPTRSLANSLETWASPPVTASQSLPGQTPRTTGGRDNWLTGGSVSFPPTLSLSDVWSEILKKKNNTEWGLKFTNFKHQPDHAASFLGYLSYLGRKMCIWDISKCSVLNYEVVSESDSLYWSRRNLYKLLLERQRL